MGQESSVPSGSKFSQTTSFYKCSNVDCQKEKDKQTAKRIKLQKEKDLSLLEKNAAKVKEKELQKRITNEEETVLHSNK
jgi:hypothetical protein